MSANAIDESFSIINRLIDEYRTAIFLATTTVVAAWLFNKLWINRCFYSSTTSMKGKTVLITGGNAGIGYETTKDLLQRGARVVMACRNSNRGQQALNKLLSETGCNENDIRLMICDLSSLNSVREFAKLYSEEEERLDVLICNAGLSWASPIMTDDGFNAIIQANYLGHFLLTHLLLDKLKKYPRSRVINVSSKLHNKIPSINWPDVFTQFQSLAWFGAYPSSKLFQILSTVKFRQELADEGIDVFALTPGWVSTSLSNPTPQAIGWFGFIACYPFVRFLKFFMAKTPKTGASTVIFCAVEPTLEQSEDFYFQNCKAAQPSSLAIDQSAADRLWKLSLKAVELHND